jgi:hypothetical protein
VKAVGDDGDRAGRVAEDELRARDREVQDENAEENAVDRGVAGRHRLWALGFWASAASA